MIDESVIIYEKVKNYIKVIFVLEIYNKSFVMECQKLKPNLKYDPEVKGWFFLSHMDKYDEILDNINTFKNILFYFNEHEKNKFTTYINRKINRVKKQSNIKVLTSKEKIEKYLKNIKIYSSKLYDHQKDDVKILSEKNEMILASEMGTGKTRSCIVYSEIQDFSRILVVCPASLKLNWKKEILMINSKANISIFPQDSVNMFTKYVIINYDMLIKEMEFFTYQCEECKCKFHKKRNIDLCPECSSDLISPMKRKQLAIKEKSFLNEFSFDLILVDEAHFIKNYKALRTKAVSYIAKKSNHKVLITGTPMKNRPIDLYTLLKVVNHPLSVNYHTYGMKYCNGKRTRFGLDFNGSSNLQELHEKIKDVMIRRKKNECLDLPEKIVTVLPIELPKEYLNTYNNAFEDYLKFCREERFKNDSEYEKNNKIYNIQYAEHLVKLNLLNQICSRAKYDIITQRVNELLEEDSDNKIVIFSNYYETINKLYNLYGNKCVKLTGSSSMNERELAVNRFQTDENIKIFIGNLVAGGVGITLTKGNIMFFMDMSFVPSDHTQAEDRIHRIGQDKNVNIFYPILENTLEEYIYDVLNEKKRVIDTSIDGVKCENITFNNNNIVGEIINKIFN